MQEMPDLSVILKNQQIEHGRYQIRNGKFHFPFLSQQLNKGDPENSRGSELVKKLLYSDDVTCKR